MHIHPLSIGLQIKKVSVIQIKTSTSFIVVVLIKFLVKQDRQQALRTIPRSPNFQPSVGPKPQAYRYPQTHVLFA